jgi:arylsulfatase A
MRTVCIALVFTIASFLNAAEVPRPNIVLILADDLGWSDLSCQGSTFYQTPHVDQLARDGMRFTAAYSATVCSPTRASIMTGKHPARLRLTDWLPGRKDMPSQRLLRPAFHQQLPLKEVTLAEALKKNGYVCANIGKWHLGGKGFGPLEQGFHINIAGDHRGTTPGYFYPYARATNALPLKGLEAGVEGEYLPDRLTTEAEKFIEQNATRPFFLYLPHYSVHVPLIAKRDLIAKYEALRKPNATQANAVYAAMIESLDDSVGRIVKKLSDLKLTERTLFIFTSDNGGLSVLEGPRTPATSNAPLRAGKGHLYEGGIRVPLIVKWPSHAKPGTTCETPVTTMDLFATILEIAGAKRAARTGVDSVSLVPLLEQRAGYVRKTIYTHYPHYSNQRSKPGSAIREGDFKLIEFFEDNHIELYNLRDDIGEKSDLSATLPKQGADLRRKLERWHRSVGAQMMRPNPDYDPAAELRQTPRADLH